MQIPGLTGILNSNSEVEESDLTQSADRKEVTPMLACINGYPSKFPKLLSANILRQLTRSFP
jgi:hypothetical protein